ncbi:hypothetical protein [Parapedobacter sp. 2B3]|uniref:hypothetical protein n=1 Tax=Parapedobacter sp. 2B3 TaxID=3342381 RepID=UPI0035B5D0FE
MNAHSIDNRTFQLIENNQVLSEIIYADPYFLKAEINVSNTDGYLVKPVGVFQTSISVTNNGTEFAKLVMNWSGNIVIFYRDKNKYVLKLNKFFHGKYIIENEDRENIIQLNPKFSWKEFHYHYDINNNISNDGISKDPLFLSLAVYAANYFVATISGANSGLV